MSKINQNQLNIGNQSALDLLIKENSAKKTLATNLAGVGVSASETNDTLEELAYKVSTVTADSTRQKIESLACGYQNHGDDGKPQFIVKNGWMFVLSNDNNGTLFYVKLSALKTEIGGYQELGGYNRSSLTNILSTSIDDSRHCKLQFSPDGLYLYITENSKIYRYTVTWGEDYATVSFGSKITLTPLDSGNSISIYSSDVSADNSKILIYDYGVNSLYEFDITNVSSDTSANATKLAGNITGDCYYFYTETDNQICCFKKDSDYYAFYLFNISSNNLSIVGNSETFAKSSDDYWRTAFCKFKDSNNKYRIIFNVGGINSDVPSFAIFDCYNKILNKYFCKTSWGASNRQNKPVSVYVYNNKYYILSSIALLIFDSNWNLLGNALNHYHQYPPDFLDALIFDGDIFLFWSDRLENAARLKVYFDKQTVYARTVAVTGLPTKQEVYFAKLTEDDLNNGYFD